MTRLANTLAAGIAGLALISIPLPALAGAQMEFPDHATIKEHIPVMAYDFKSAPPLARVCTGAGGSGSFSITKPVDASSPKLAEAAQAKDGTTVIVDDQQSNGRHVAFQFTGATISAIAPDAKDPAMEKVSFNYSKIQWLTVGCTPPKAAAPRSAGDPFGGSGGSPSYGGGGGYGRY